MKYIFAFFIPFFISVAQANEAFDSPQGYYQLSLSAGWSRVEEKFGFGGDKYHSNLDLAFYVHDKAFINFNLSSIQFGKSSNTSLNSSAFHLGGGYRHKAFRTWLGLGVSSQEKTISNAAFHYVDPSPNTPSQVLVVDSFFSWIWSAAYDFVLVKPSNNFIWHLLLGPQLFVTDTFENNGFKPVLSAGLSLSLY